MSRNRKVQRFKGVSADAEKEVLEFEGGRKALEKEWREEVKNFKDLVAPRGEGSGLEIGGDIGEFAKDLGHDISASSGGSTTTLGEITSDEADDEWSQKEVDIADAVRVLKENANSGQKALPSATKENTTLPAVLGGEIRLTEKQATQLGTQIGQQGGIDLWRRALEASMKGSKEQRDMFNKAFKGIVDKAFTERKELTSSEKNKARADFAKEMGSKDYSTRAKHLQDMGIDLKDLNVHVVDGEGNLKKVDVAPFDKKGVEQKIEKGVNKLIENQTNLKNIANELKKFGVDKSSELSKLKTNAELKLYNQAKQIAVGTGIKGSAVKAGAESRRGVYGKTREQSAFLRRVAHGLLKHSKGGKAGERIKSPSQSKYSKVMSNKEVKQFVKKFASTAKSSKGKKGTSQTKTAQSAKSKKK